MLKRALGTLCHKVIHITTQHPYSNNVTRSMKNRSQNREKHSCFGKNGVVFSANPYTRRVVAIPLLLINPKIGI